MVVCFHLDSVTNVTADRFTNTGVLFGISSCFPRPCIESHRLKIDSEVVCAFFYIFISLNGDDQMNS